MADFRIIMPRFFSDERVYSMTPSQKLLLAFLIAGIQACSQTETGIFEIGRGEMAMHTNIPIEEVEEIIRFFNEKKNSLVEWDEKSHMIFVKSFFKYNSAYLTTPEKVASSVKKDFKKSHEKCPRFWAEFSKINHNVLNKAYLGLNVQNKSYLSYKHFFENLFALEKDYFDAPEKNEKIKNISLVSISQMEKDLTFIATH